MPIVYEKLTSGNSKEALDVISRSFASREAIGKSLGAKENDLRGLFEPLIYSAFKYSFIAKDTGTGEVLGGILCEDFFHRVPFHNKTNCQKVTAMIAVVSDLEEKFAQENPDIKKNACLYQAATFVKDGHNKRGIGTSLYHTSINDAITCNFKKIVTISSGPISQHIRINKLGFEKVSSIFYADYQVNGIAVFSQKKIDTKECMLLVKNI